MKDYYIDDEGIIRWKSNNSVPPEDCLQEFYGCGRITAVQYLDSRKVRSKELTIFLANYRKQMENYVYSPEELFEMRSAFGEGVKVVNVITGKEIEL